MRTMSPRAHDGRDRPGGRGQRDGGAGRRGGASGGKAAPEVDLTAEAGHDSLTDVPGGVRLQKVLAAAGIGSRRHCEELIGEGRVEVDGEIVRRYGARVDPDHQIIKVDGRRIPSRQGMVYLALNKPAGVLTTMSDDRGRPTISDFLGDRAERLFHVGRLDYDTEGLMLLTNDGDLAHRLAHPRYGVAKTYLADVAGPLPRDLGRDHPSRGAQAHRPAAAGRGRPSGQPSGPHPGRPGPARQSPARQHPHADHQGNRRTLRGCRPLAGRIRAGRLPARRTARHQVWYQEPLSTLVRYQDGPFLLCTTGGRSSAHR